MIDSAALAFAYPGGALLRFPEVQVAQGGTLLLRGDSGSGKSTWLALAAGLLRPAAGRLQVAGDEPALLGPAQRDCWRGRSVGFLPQRLHLSDALDVQGNLALAHYAAGVPTDHAAIADALAALGLTGLSGRKPSQLSGGQAQRVALARAVLLAPRVLLADEPTASLDDRAAADAMAWLRRAADRCRATLVVATHDARARQALQGADIHEMCLKRPQDMRN